MWYEDEDATEVMDVAMFALRLAREGWTPPKPPVDPDVLAFRGWVKVQYPEGCGALIDAGEWDGEDECAAFLAGVRYARGEQS